MFKCSRLLESALIEQNEDLKGVPAYEQTAEPLLDWLFRQYVRTRELTKQQ